MADQKKWTVTTSSDRPLVDIANDLEKCGFKIGQTLEQVGCFTGSASDEIAEQIRSIKGVTDVSPDDAIDIGPPDSPVTW